MKTFLTTFLAALTYGAVHVWAQAPAADVNGLPPLSAFGPGSTLPLHSELPFRENELEPTLWFQSQRLVGRGAREPSQIEHGPRCEITRPDPRGPLPANSLLRVIDSSRPHDRASGFWQFITVTEDGSRITFVCLGDYDWLGYFAPTLADLQSSLPKGGFVLHRVAPR